MIRLCLDQNRYFYHPAYYEDLDMDYNLTLSLFFWVNEEGNDMDIPIFTQAALIV